MKKLLPLLLLSLAFAPTVLAEGSEIQAKAAYVVDLSSGKVLFAKNELAQLPLASLTKLMTVYLAKSLGAVQQGVVSEEQACFTLVTSSNEQAEIIGRTTGDAPKAMSALAKKIGMKQTFYLNSSGLDISESLSGAYGSARDQALLLTQFYKNFRDLLACTTQKNARLGNLVLSNTNKDLGKIIGLIGSKTGLTDLAGGNLAVVFDLEINRPVVVVVLGSSEDGRFQDVLTLINMVMQKEAI